MKFNELTYHISLVIIVITALYTLVYSGLTGLLLCSSITLITAAFFQDFEIVTAITVIFALFYTAFLKRYLQKLEPFTDKEILSRLDKMKSSYHPVKQNINTETGMIPGCYNPSIEGFASAVPDDKKQEKKEDGQPSQSTAAPAKQGEGVNSVQVQEVTKNVQANTQAQASTQTAKPSGFQDISAGEFKSATGGLFKLGEMPSENKDGPHLDAGKTIMQSMASFDPKTISSMTDDTKKLLETQKSLMSMLNQMRPVLADGRELLSTFSGMFGGNGNGGASLFNKQ
jgi:hypothetical protein